MSSKSAVTSAVGVLFAGSLLTSLLPQQALALTSTTTHSFFINNLNPTGLFKVVTTLNGQTSATNAPNDSYNNLAQWVGTIGISGTPSPPKSATSVSSPLCATAYASSDASFSSFLSGPWGAFSGFVTSTSSATTAPLVGSCFIHQEAKAKAAAKINIFEGFAKPFGQIKWQPKFESGVSVCEREIRDPVKVRFTDSQGTPLLLPEEEKLLSIRTVLQGVPVSTVDLDRCRTNVINPFIDPTINWTDKAVAGRLRDGLFEIDVNNPFLVNPGLLRIVAKDGLVIDKVASGRYSPVSSLLPDIGQPAVFDLPFSADFPEEIVLDYDFSPKITDPNIDKSIELDGGVTVDVPGPLPVLGVGIAFGYSRRLRGRIKRAALA